MQPLTQSSAAVQPESVIAAIRDVTGEGTHILHEPYFPGNEKAYVFSCIEDGWVSSVGSFVDRFEKDLATACGAKHAVVVANGTVALQMALHASGLQPGEEVLLPALTFVATANAVMHAGGVPHFVDCEETSLGMCPDALEAYLKQIVSSKDGKAVNSKTGRRIRALMPVHIFGHPCQMDKLARIAHTYQLELIEDAAEALGSESGGKKIGSQHMAAFSFNGNKILTTGGGGAVTTNDAAQYQKIKHLTTTAKQPHAWDFVHDEVAWNFRLPNLNAALGCAQLETLPDFLRAKRALAQRYIEAFSNIDSGAAILTEPEGTKSNYWLVALKLDACEQPQLEHMLAALHEAGLLCRPLWKPLHSLPIYADCPRAGLPVTKRMAQCIINVPSSVKLGLPYVS